MFNSITVQSTVENPSAWLLLLVVLLSFVLSTILALIYQKTYRGLSYSRNYVQSLVLISIIAAMVIQAVGDSLARGIGIMAAMAIIRFRTNFKDPRDTLFLFASLAAGISCGAYAFFVGIVGTLSFAVVALILYYSPLGPNRYFDGMLRFNLPSAYGNTAQLEKVMYTYCKAFSLVTLREMEQGRRMDHAYHVKMRVNANHSEFLATLRSLEHIAQVNLMMQEATVDL